MYHFLPYLFKSLWRHRTRTVLTVLGSAVALFVFCFVGAIQNGLDRLTTGTDAQRTLIVFQENRFCPTSSRLPQDYERIIRDQSGVANVFPIKVFTNNCRASLDAIVFHGLPAEAIEKHRAWTFTSGSADLTHDDAALVGRAVAQRRGILTGDRFTIGEVSVQVTGVFTSSVLAEENAIYTHLDFLQRARGGNNVGIATQFEVHLTPAADPELVSRAIDEQFRAGPVSTTTRPKGLFQAETLSDLAELIEFIHWLGYACVALVLGLVATTTVMSVQDRIQEHAVLLTLGLRPVRVCGLIVVESTVLALLGGLIGIGSGTLALVWSRMSIAAEGVTLAFEPSVGLLLKGVIIASVVGMVAGIIPGRQAAATEIVLALRRA